MMSDNVLQTLQHAIQDVIAPDVRELKVRVSSIEKQMETQYHSLRDQIDASFKALMAAIGES
jgi:phosphate uptake regulator